MVIIRKAEQEDIERARELLSAREVSWENEVYSSVYFQRLIRTQNIYSQKGAIFLVAEEKCEIIGTICGEYSVDENWAELIGVVVKEGFRGRGIGSTLIKKFEDIVRERGVSVVELMANVGTLGKFIHKLGYTKGESFVSCRKKLKE